MLVSNEPSAAWRVNSHWLSEPWGDQANVAVVPVMARLRRFNGDGQVTIPSVSYAPRSMLLPMIRALPSGSSGR